MRTHLRKLMEKNDGMTLVEVIVAFAIFAIASIILLYGVTMAIKVMGNSASIQSTSEKNFTALDTLDTEIQQDSDITVNKLTTPKSIVFSTKVYTYNTGGAIQDTAVGSGVIRGDYLKATPSLNDDGSLKNKGLRKDLALTLFTANAPTTTPTVPPVPTTGTEKELTTIPYVPKGTEGDLSSVVSENADNWESTGYERFVVNSTIVSGKGNVSQVFLTGEPSIDAKQNEGINLATQFLYLSGDIKGVTPGNSNKNYSYFKMGSKDESVLFYCAKNITITMNSTNQTMIDDGEYTLKEGYYLIKGEIDLFQLTYGDNKSNLRNSFSTNWTSSTGTGYYLDQKDTTCLNQLQSELKKRNIAVQVKDHPNEYEVMKND